MSSTINNRELVKLEPSQVINLYELDTTAIGGGFVFKFHAGKNENFQDIVFGGQVYTALPLEASGYEYDGKGSLPRPKIKIANPNGIISNLVNSYDNLLNAKVTRLRVFARFLDDSNFEGNKNPYGAPSQEVISTEIYYINQKVVETNEFIEFELSTKQDLESMRLPKRQFIANICTARYRDGIICPFAGPPKADFNGRFFLITDGTPNYGLTSIRAAKPITWVPSQYDRGDYVLYYTFDNYPVFYVAIENTTENDIPNKSSRWVADSCQRNVGSCKIRFPNGALPFGGFPGVARFPFQN